MSSSFFVAIDVGRSALDLINSRDQIGAPSVIVPSTDLDVSRRSGGGALIYIRWKHSR